MCVLKRCRFGLDCGTIVQATSSSLTFLGFAALLGLRASPVMRSSLLRVLFPWFNEIVLWRISVPEDNIFER